jgi:hypothetical protein
MTKTAPKSKNSTDWDNLFPLQQSIARALLGIIAISIFIIFFLI